MARKITGITLLIIGGLLGFVLLMYGGPVLPHIIGPVVSITTGLLLLNATRKSK